MRRLNNASILLEKRWTATVKQIDNFWGNRKNIYIQIRNSSTNSILSEFPNITPAIEGFNPSIIEQTGLNFVPPVNEGLSVGNQIDLNFGASAITFFTNMTSEGTSSNPVLGPNPIVNYPKRSSRSLITDISSQFSDATGLTFKIKWDIYVSTAFRMPQNPYIQSSNLNLDDFLYSSIVVLLTTEDPLFNPKHNYLPFNFYSENEFSQ